MTDLVKVLFLAADPFTDRTPLRLDHELRAIQRAVRSATRRDRIEVIPRLSVRVSELQPLLREVRPQVVHFSGHGHATGTLSLGDEHGDPTRVSGAVLAELFALLAPRPALVVLNACDSAPIAESIGRVADFAVGMNQPVTDGSAITFSSHFYAALADGEPVQRAFRAGVVQIRLEDRPGAEIPTLHVRPGVDVEQPLVAPGPPRAVKSSPTSPVDDDWQKDMSNEFSVRHGGDNLPADRRRRRARMSNSIVEVRGGPDDPE